MNREEIIKVLEQAESENPDGAIAEKIAKALALARSGKNDPQEAMSLTCFGSLAFCCATPVDASRGIGRGGKNCFWRDAAITLSGMSQEDLSKLKEKWNKELLGRK